MIEFQVVPADSSIVYVDEGKLIDVNTKKYQIQLIDYHWRLAELAEAMGIIITSPITKQTLRVRLFQFVQCRDTRTSTHFYIIFSF